MVKRKVNKKDFLASIAASQNLPQSTVIKVYNAMVEELHDILASGRTVSLTGFGSFYLQEHKGHPIQFDASSKIPDYIVLKFSASDVLNKRFREEYRQGLIEVPS